MAANTILEDGHEWIQRAGQLWGDYDTCSSYTGIGRATFRNYVWRLNLRKIKHGRKTLVNKEDLDRKSGAVAA